MATVVEVDIARKRIALSLKDGGTETPTKRPEVKGQKPANKKPEPMNAFQAKLMELKKSFKE